MAFDKWVTDDNMQKQVNNANQLLDHWQDKSWLKWVVPVVLMLRMQVIMQKRKEAAEQKAHKEARLLAKVTQHKEEQLAKEAAVAKRMAGGLAGSSKWLTRKTILRKVSKVMLIEDTEMVSNSRSEDILGASQSKMQELKDLWAVVKADQVPAGYVRVSLHLNMLTSSWQLLL